MINCIHNIGTHFHGHIPECPQHDPNCYKWKSHLRKKLDKFQYFTRIKKFYNSFNISMIFKYNDLFDCMFKNHYLHNPEKFKNKYKYTDFLEQVYTQNIKGFLVLNGLSIRKSSRTPYQGLYYVGSHCCHT